MYGDQLLATDIDTIRNSGYFDADWYITTYADVRQIGMDPAEHYLKYGASMRRDPGPQFCTSFYLDTHTDVARSGRNPLLHFLDCNSEFAPDSYLVLNAAARVAERGQHELAIQLAERYLPEKLAYSASILRANAAIVSSDEENWLRSLNSYLSHFDLAPLRLQGNGPLVDRLVTAQLSSADAGPMVSVIMPAYNSDATVEAAARSILRQTWRNLELLIVDDASTDGTWAKMQEIAEMDGRVKIRRNKVNVGPYVSKNIALQEAKGEWITGHDADDWAHPQRLERHLGAVLKKNSNIRASRTYMIRMEPNGWFDSIDTISGDRLDGVALLGPITALFERSFLLNELGSWDCVRFGADNELISRATFLQGKEFDTQDTISMICLDRDGSLTNNPRFGISKKYGFGEGRRDYHQAWKSWHAQEMTRENAKYDFPPSTRRFPLPEVASVPFMDIEENIKARS